MSTLTSYHSIFKKVEKKRLKYVNKLSILLAIVISISFSLPYSLSHGTGIDNDSGSNITGAAGSHSRGGAGISSGSSSRSASGPGSNGGVNSSTSTSFWWNCVLATFMYRGPIFLFAILLIKLARQFDTTILYSKHKTLASQSLHTVFSKRYLTVIGFHLASSFLIFLCSYIQSPIPIIQIAKEYRQKDYLNDNFVYFIFNAFTLSIAYSFQHLVFQRNRLSLFKYGVAKIRPSTLGLFQPIPRLIIFALVINIIIVFIFTPVVYYLFSVGNLIYKLNSLGLLLVGIDTERHSTNLGSKWQNLLQISWCSFHTILSWEVVNHIFNVYSSIGCIDGKKPISGYSSDPLNTLITGLRDSNDLTRLTAFQELAYISTEKISPEAVKLRSAIFNAHSKFGPIWSTIVDECSLIIRETCSRVNYRSVSDLKRQQQQLHSQQAEPQLSWITTTTSPSKSTKTEIFGNSTKRASNSETLKLRKYDEKSPSPKSIPSAQSTSAKTDVKSKTTSSNSGNKISTQFSQYVELVSAYTNSFYTALNKLSSKVVLPPLVKSVHQTISSKYFQYRDDVIVSNFGIIFRISLKRDCESRIVDPVTFGNAVISISNLLLHAIEEDKTGTIQNHDIADVLTILERPIRAMNNYTESLPPSIDLSLYQRSSPELTKQHLIALLHDLSIKEFFDICVKYNSKLNDLVLSARVFKLAKRVIDAAIAQRTRQPVTAASGYR